MAPKSFSDYKKNLDEALKKKTIETKGSKGRIAVLGSFDTWVFMHFIAVELAKIGFTAVTSIYEYYKKLDFTSEYFREKMPQNPDESLIKHLQEHLIKKSDKAVIIYSVPAAHYNEAEWCAENKIDTLGIAFVRSIKDENCCPYYGFTTNPDYGYCNGERNAWFCINQSKCPFIDQSIAKNQLEYFMGKEEHKMKLICVEKIEDISKLLTQYLEKEMDWPKPKPYVFEFRCFLTKDRKEEIEEKISELVVNYNEEFYVDYKYEDKYYKPKMKKPQEWVSKNKTIRTRKHSLPSTKYLELLQSEIERNDIGFITDYPFGRKQIMKDEETIINEFFPDMSLEYFLSVNKNKGRLYLLKDPINANIYIEEVSCSYNDVYHNLGWSMEVEFWIENKDDYDHIKNKYHDLIKKLNIKYEEVNIMPMQEICMKNFSN